MNASLANKLILALGVICLGLAAAEFQFARHGYSDIENQPLFYCAIGFIAYAAVIFFAKALRHFVSRSEDYYGREAVDGENESGADTEARDV